MTFFNNPRMLASPRIDRVDLGNGGFILSNPEQLGEISRSVADWLEYWADRTPNALFLAERGDDDEWVKLTYSEVRRKVGMLAQGLLNLGLPSVSPVVCLSDANIDQALLMLATLHIGRPFSTVSSAYSRLSQDHAKIAGILCDLQPGVVYASDGAVYAPAISASKCDCHIIVSNNSSRIDKSHLLNDLMQTAETPEVMLEFSKITPQTHAKYLLTSGSTGGPKIVVNTHRMLCANQKQIQIAWPFLKEEKPILVSWLPWSHTFGTNYNFNMVLCNGGAFYFDMGKPVPGLMELSVRNLREIQPNLLLNIPRFFDSLLPMMDEDETIARDCFGRLRAVFYAGAALRGDTWERFNSSVQRVVGERVLFSSSLGSTETAPVGTYVHWLTEDPRCVGLPVAGCSIKFLPNAGKLELRIKGPQVFSGYLRNEQKTVEAFDEDGYYKIGDAGLLIDPAQPEQGIAFDGRVAEDFKLTTGTWVSVGILRLKALAALAPYAQDVVVAGQDRDEIGLLIFPTLKAEKLSLKQLRSHVSNALSKLDSESGGGLSQSPKRAIFLKEPPSIESGEITDKGYINQRLVLSRRAADVERLYKSGEDEHVICSE